MRTLQYHEVRHSCIAATPEELLDCILPEKNHQASPFGPRYTNMNVFTGSAWVTILFYNCEVLTSLTCIPMQIESAFQGFVGLGCMS